MTTPTTATPPSPPAIPPTLRQATRLARYQLKDYFRSRRFILMFGLVIAIGGILTAVVGYYRPPDLLANSAGFYSVLWGNGITLVIVFAGVIFGGDAIAGEFQNKTGYFLMGQPIRRVTVYIGKYLAALVAAFTALLLFALILVGNGVYYFGAGAFTAAFAESFALATAFLFALLGATFLFSSMFKTSTYATLVVAVLFLFGFMILQDVVVGLAKTEPWFIISYASAVIGDVFLSPYPPHIAQTSLGPGAGSFTVYTPTVAEGVAIMILYFVVTSVVGLWLFEREEFA